MSQFMQNQNTFWYRHATTINLVSQESEVRGLLVWKCAKVFWFPELIANIPVSALPRFATNILATSQDFFQQPLCEHLSVLKFEAGVSSSTLVTCVIFISIFSATKFQDKSELGKSSKSKANCHNFIFCIHLMVHWINLFKKFKTEKRSPRVFL